MLFLQLLDLRTLRARGRSEQSASREISSSARFEVPEKGFTDEGVLKGRASDH